jgi:hypothetical protein
MPPGEPLRVLTAAATAVLANGDVTTPRVAALALGCLCSDGSGATPSISALVAVALTLAEAAGATAVAAGAAVVAVATGAGATAAAAAVELGCLALCRLLPPLWCLLLLLPAALSAPLLTAVPLVAPAAAAAEPTTLARWPPPLSRVNLNSASQTTDR